MEVNIEPELSGPNIEQEDSTVPEACQDGVLQSCSKSQLGEPNIKQESPAPLDSDQVGASQSCSKPLDESGIKSEPSPVQNSGQHGGSHYQNPSCAEPPESDEFLGELANHENVTSTPDIRAQHEEETLQELSAMDTEHNEPSEQEQNPPSLQSDTANEPLPTPTTDTTNNVQNLNIAKKARKNGGPRRSKGRTVKEMFEERHKALQALKAPASNSQTELHRPTKRLKLSPTENQGSSTVKTMGIMQQIVGHNVIAASKGHGDYEKAARFSATTQKTQFDILLKNCPKSSDLRKARGELNVLREAVKKFGAHNIKAADGNWKLKGMTTPLFGYQVIGVAWMIERELSVNEPNGPFGGICADAMGLGKTVEAIATMVANPPGADVPIDQRSTLIVVPASIKWQWFSEIEKHAHDTLPRVMIYKASEKIQRIRITDCNVVLATWKELSTSSPFPDKKTYNELRTQLRNPKSKSKPEDDESTPIEEWIAGHPERRGQLHEIHWYRIIFDESHHIKNHLSRQSLAACSLKGKYRWALSGTPIMNRLEEFYAYFRFLNNLSLAPSYRSFKRKFCGQNEGTANDPLDTLLAKSMLRRTTADLFMGRPIVDLPLPTECTVVINFSPGEEILYRAFEDRLRQLFNESFAPGDERNKLTHFFAQLTRLRQFTAHPLLIENQMKVAFEINHLEEVQKQILHLPSPDLTLYNRIKVWIKSKKLGEVNLTDLDAENAYNCLLCSNPATDPVKISIKNCKHTFCRNCIENDVDLQSGRGLDQPSCPECQAAFDPETSLQSLDSEEYGSRLSSAARKGKDALKYHPRVQRSDWIEQYDKGKVPLFQSAKIEAVVGQISRWLDDAPTDKIIIFTQWRRFATILGRDLEEKKIPFVYYTGDKTATKRDVAVRKFESDPSTKVMISGLGCGGIGLNLACANRVINVDPWWNTCIEQQAFGRVYRLPQSKNTYFAKIIIRNSIDSRIIKLQAKKERIVDPRMKRRLTVEEMAGLFGRVTVGNSLTTFEDENGKTTIERDYSDDEEDGDEERESDHGSDGDYVD
ncbi:uncharacterized protein BP5553_04708 [Venustampulla echinocandica]|uniref:P-loop containing nucleoside triphosphate hydrolase n=1 Tax=Venustampulla echinocandica TaxID=2656787 RepID=A0A370TP28_9HELO|nr:uncharacterized protein BP5553_04708 [Venustampulla echinocandica]RDL37275.1 hypothetical protein BP5553_04708 [Venustampulla echinocandica]